MKADFQIVCSFDSSNLKEKLLDFLKGTIDESTTLHTEIEKKPDNLEEWSIFDGIEIKYNYQSKEDTFIAGFTLEVDETFKEITPEFGNKLREDDSIKVIFKYVDKAMLEEHQKYAMEIYEIEMKLREVISFIFLDTYEGDYYNLLEFQKVKGKGIRKEKKQDIFEEKFENEFFYLIFSQYKELYLPNIIKGEILSTLFEKAKSDEDLKRQILSLGIFKRREKYNPFLKSIEDDLQSIEELRNCIAHNRLINDDIIDSYEHGKEKLELSINNFWEEIRNEKTEDEKE